MDEESADSTQVSSLRSIVRGSSLFAIGEVFRNGAGFLFNWALVTALGANLYGIYTYGHLIVELSQIVTKAGTDNGLLRYLPKYADNPARQARIVTSAYVGPLVASVLGAGLLYVFAPLMSTLTLDDPLFIDVLRILSFSLPAYTTALIIGSVFRSVKRPEYDVFLEVAKPGAQLCAAGIGLLVGFSLIQTTLALLIASGMVLALSVLIFYTRSSVKLALPKSRNETTEFYRFSLPLMLSDAANVLYKQIDVLMVGFILASTQVGIYRIATLVALVLSLPLGGINLLFPPVASELYTRGKPHELQSVYRIVTRWSFTITLFLAAGAIVYRDTLLSSVFGSTIATGSAVLAVLVFGQLFNAAVGPSNYVLMMTDHQYLIFINHWSFGVLNVILNYYLLTQFGLIGAALATASVLAAVNIVRVVEVWYLEGIVPYSITFVKPTVSCVIAGVAMSLLREYLSGFALLFIGGGVGFVTFGGLLYLAGIEEEDKEVFSDMLPG